MRYANILMIGMLGMITAPALAQSPAAGTDMNGARPGHVPGVGTSLPLSNKASNIDSSDTKSTIAPTLPSSGLGINATARQYLGVARSALMSGQSGKAQQSLEMAETALLSRSVPQGQTDTPSSNPAVTQIENARHALGSGDKASALQILNQMLMH